MQYVCCVYYSSQLSETKTQPLIYFSVMHISCTVVNIEESAEIIEDRPHYNVTNLDAPDPILQTTAPAKQTKSSASSVSVEKAASKPILKMKYEPFIFPLSKLHSIREHKPTGQGYPHVSFYLKDGKSLPVLYFHDGGITTLLKTMSPRYIYLLRSVKDPTLITVEDFSKYNAMPSKSHTGIIASLAEHPGHEIKVCTSIVHVPACVR